MAMVIPASRPTAGDVPVAINCCWKHRLLPVAAWCVFITFYALGMLFFATSAYCYWILKNSPVELYLRIYDIGIASKNYRLVAVAYGAIALLHAVKSIQLIVPSIRRRQFVLNSRILPDISRQTTAPSLYQAVGRALIHTYGFVFTETGLLGVSGPCFDLLLLVRELLETVLQTVQAYRMSQFLSRAWLNRFYVSLLVLNCWLMALVHTLFHDKPITKYVVSLTCDLLLDFVSSMVVPFTLIAIYSKDVVPGAADLFGFEWYDEAWAIQAMNEFQIILVASWADLVFRLVFALSMISTLSILQRFVAAGVKQRRVSTAGALKHWNSIVPEARRMSNAQTDSVTLAALKRANSAVASNTSLTKTLRTICIMWGSIVLALHGTAEVIQDLPQCVMQVRPWGITRPSCSSVLINCYQDHIAGNTSEIHAQIVGLHAPSVTLLVVRHCSALEIPATIQSLEYLKALTIYNSSITRWDLDAAITGVNHPGIVMVVLARVRTLDGKVPLGLQSNDFPLTVRSICFLYTNIREIPGGLDIKWPPGVNIEFDTAELTEIPDALIRMAPSVFVVAGNRLDQVPKEVFEISVLRYLDLSYTELPALPSDVVITTTALTSFNLDGTNISSFPAWVDKWLQFPGDFLYPQRISAAGSPYCAERNMIFAGMLTNFTVTDSSQQSSLMNASKDNWDFLQRTVSCVPSLMYRFPIVLEDMKAAIT